MKQIDTPTRQKRKLYISPTILGISFVCEKGFATSTQFKTGDTDAGSTNNPLEQFDTNGSRNGIYF